MITKIIPVAPSTRGYCQEILLLHRAHFPPSARKLNNGTSSNHRSVLLHEKHCERPCNPKPVLYRRITTFKKLPIVVPNKKKKKESNASILYYNTINKMPPNGGILLKTMYPTNNHLVTSCIRCSKC